MSVHPIQSRAVGTFKFESCVSQATLVRLLRNLRQEFGNRFIDLHLRDPGQDNCICLGFCFKYEGNGETAFNQAFHTLRSFLVSELGSKPGKPQIPRSVKSWSVSNVLFYT